MYAHVCTYDLVLLKSGVSLQTSYMDDLSTRESGVLKSSDTSVLLFVSLFCHYLIHMFKYSDSMCIYDMHTYIFPIN